MAKRAPKQEAPKQEAPKQEAPKQEATQQQEAPKQEAPKQETQQETQQDPITVVISSSKKGEFVTMNALAARAIEPSEVSSAGITLRDLCLNLLSGNVHAAIIAAHESKAGVGSVFPGMSQGMKDALRKSLNAGPDKLRAAWQAKCLRDERDIEISLNGLRAALTYKPKPRTISLKDALTALFNGEPKLARGLPVELLDVFIEYDILEDMPPEDDDEDEDEDEDESE
jgi:hypothetical protein